MKSLYIFDIDGTIALIEHRLHYIKRDRLEADWKGFYRACDKDIPNTNVINTMEKLKFAGSDIWFFSGRNAGINGEVKQKTIDWIAEHTSFMTHEINDILIMRQMNDYTADDTLKQSMYNNMLIEDQNRLVATFDDRQRVVDMWRRNNITCFQVAKGDF